MGIVQDGADFTPVTPLPPGRGLGLRGCGLGLEGGSCLGGGGGVSVRPCVLFMVTGDWGER